MRYVKRILYYVQIINIYISSIIKQYAHCKCITLLKYLRSKRIYYICAIAFGVRNAYKNTQYASRKNEIQ